MPARLLSATAIFGAAALCAALGAPALWVEGRQALGFLPRDATWAVPPTPSALQRVAAAVPEDAVVLVVLAAPDPEVLATFMTASYWLAPRRLRFGTETSALEGNPDCGHAVVFLPAAAPAPERAGWQVRARWPVPQGLLWWLGREPR